MIASLPLLIADGHFTRLEDMKDDQMEKFITFLVQCSNLPTTSQINENLTGKHQVTEPPWWLPDLPFVYPLTRPKKVTRKWRTKLKTLIKLCYKFYNFELLIDLSADLARQQLANAINLIPKGNNLTTVVRKRPRKVIATITNENIEYDIKRKPLLQTCSKTCQYSYNYPSSEVTSEIFDDDNCYIEEDPHQQKSDFLNYLHLASKDSNFSSVPSAREYNNGRINLIKTPYIPFSSQLGRRLATRVKYMVRDQTHLKRLERLNRYLNTPPIPLTELNTNKENLVTRDKFLSNEWTHSYKFPGKTFGAHRGNRSSRTAFLTAYCKPCCVSLTPIYNPDVIVKVEPEISPKFLKPAEISEAKDEKKVKLLRLDQIKVEGVVKPKRNYTPPTTRRKNMLSRQRFRDVRLKGFQNFSSAIPLVRLSPRLNGRQTRAGREKH